MVLRTGKWDFELRGLQTMLHSSGKNILSLILLHEGCAMSAFLVPATPRLWGIPVRRGLYSGEFGSESRH